MGYTSLEACLLDLERNGQLRRVREEVDPHLEMAAIHLRVYERGGPALLFERVRGCRFRAASNIFGTLERARFLFRDTLARVQALVELKYDPLRVLRRPLRYAAVAPTAAAALPQRRAGGAVRHGTVAIRDLPQIVHWPRDGGPFITLPQVYTEDVERPGVMQANVGMYRVQLGGNDYEADREVGLHYQIHRGIGVHQAKANEAGVPLRVSIFVGGPPAHTLAAVMPLPEGLPELVFAGVLGNRAFRYFRDDEGFCVSADADFAITGTVHPHEVKPEGPFGDHLGYYSLAHPFPVMRVHRVYHRRDAIWPFTVVGRPPQEDTSFGALIHDMTGAAIPREIPGLHAVHAVDAAGVHPLLFAIGSERYTPYQRAERPQELLTIANHIFGKNQLSLAKYLFICAREDDPALDIHEVDVFLQHMLARVDLARDLHFQTNTTIDTLDYSGTGLNAGSKVAIAAVGAPRRSLWRELPAGLRLPRPFGGARLVMPGILAVEAPAFVDYAAVQREIAALDAELGAQDLSGLPLLVLCDDAGFAAASVSNFVWVTFTRSNPSHDVHGIGSFVEHKHWGCRGPLVIDARRKPHHAPPLERDPAVERRVDRLGERGASLHGII
ncbi:MAG TPA: UbiD family decarboxylase [Vicinamibacterales bacterium]|nr:UbiD family decarboxylase [Vicinamibacterales bacterium]